MKNINKIRTTWEIQGRDKSGRFKTLKKNSSKDQINKTDLIKKEPPAIVVNHYYTIEQVKKAFLDGCNYSSFFPPSKRWEIYKRDNGLE
jgi:hypothetical protein